MRSGPLRSTKLSRKGGRRQKKWPKPHKWTPEDGVDEKGLLVHPQPVREVARVFKFIFLINLQMLWNLGYTSCCWENNKSLC